MTSRYKSFITDQIVFVVVAIFLLFGIQARASQPGAAVSSSYQIGVLAPLTGKYSEWGQYMQNGLLLASDVAQTDAFRLKPKIHFEDTRSSVKDAVGAFNKLVDQYSPIAIFAMDSEVAKAVAPLATDRKVLLLVTIAGGSNLFKPGDWALRWYQNATSIGSALAEHAINAGYKRVAIIHENHVFANSVNVAVVDALKKGNAKVSDTETFNSDDQSARDQAAKVIRSKPDAIIVSGTGGRPYVSAIRSLRELGWGGPILSDDSMNLPNVQRDLENAAIGIIFTTSAFDPMAPANELQQRFIDSYRAKYGQPPTDTAAYSYEFLLMAHQLVNAGATSSPSLYEKFRRMENHNTVFGPVSFGGNHELTLKMALRVLVDEGGVLKAIPAGTQKSTR